MTKAVRLMTIVKMLIIMVALIMDSNFTVSAPSWYNQEEKNVIRFHFAGREAALCGSPFQLADYYLISGVMSVMIEWIKLTVAALSTIFATLSSRRSSVLVFLILFTSFHHNHTIVIYVRQLFN